MVKSELISRIFAKTHNLSHKDVELSINTIIESMSNALSDGERIEIRDFGSFSLRHRGMRLARNPKTGDPVASPPKYIPHFKAGKELREKVNQQFGIPIKDQ